MTNSQEMPPIVQAARQNSPAEAALLYESLGFSVIPLDGKRPALKSWRQFQKERAGSEVIQAWSQSGLFGNVGIICGAVSGNLIVLRS